MTGRGKILTGLFTLAVLYTFAPVTDTKADDTTGTSTITDNNSYTVTIPAELSVGTNGTGSMEVSATMDAYSELNISVTSENNYELECGTQKVSYSLSGTDGFSDTDKKITYSTKDSTDGSEKKFSTTLTATVNGTAPVSGTYKDNLTFTISCQADSTGTTRHKLIFDANGGTVAITNKKLAAGAVYGELTTPERVGYQFGGWFTAETDGTQVNADTLMQGADTTIYAHWTPNTYSVVYDNNVANHTKASGSMEASTMTYDREQCLRRCTFQNSDSGAHFTGWNTKADGTGMPYPDGQKVSNLTAETGSITLYAQWTYENIVKVQFEDVNGNYLEQDTQKVIEKTVPAGETIAWSVEDLAAYKENPTRWEKQWQMPENDRTVNYTTCNASRTTTIKIARQLYYLDLNSQWYDSSGKGQSGGGNLIWNNVVTARVKVEINGIVQPQYTATTDYFVKQRYGSTFKFTVTMQDGYQFNGVTERIDQPLSNVQVNGIEVTGIVTGERHVKNEGGNEYDATTVALNIQKLSSESTTNSSEKQSMDEISENSDSIITDQNTMQKEESEAEIESITELEEILEVEPETTGVSENEEPVSDETDQLEMEPVESEEPDQPITEEETQEATVGE